MIDTRLHHRVQPLFDQTGKNLCRAGFTPVQITLAACVTGLAAGFFISRQWMMMALVLLWLSGIMDVLDGTVARLSGRVSATGALMDLILDRMVEAAVILGFYAVAPEHALAHLLFFVGVIFNFSTFLAAGALFPNRGGKSMHYDPGILERTETFLLFTGMILWPAGQFGLLMVFNALMFVTGILRFYRLIRQEQISSKSDEKTEGK
ncbi:CDP-alcohol phosphatidyltransferase family protein [Anoxynatronum buryatiense]|uniref:Phosphatidylglycerophosphate synthase n=1 Tax=Anoxynatronum buryatiense TaxID=489973 RepID=A0AA45WXV6_9CLOT|nr:CDP-alcohol phosphatidyltransferase family protein [Anoxynatronum buryatiense]SMP66361.1 Phosphatidylglycerophosphate synthase [Anoxynatronum buryatiense]